MSGIKKIAAFIAAYGFALTRLVLFVALVGIFIFSGSKKIVLAILLIIVAISACELFWGSIKDVFKKIAAFLAAKKEKIGILGAGYLGNALMVYAFNWVLYPFVVWKFGLVLGGFVIMTILSFIVCYLTILFYDWAKKDWLGIETLKGVKEYSGNSNLGKVSAWIMKKGELVTLLFLSVKFDPFIATVYMRHGANQYDGMSRRDWKIFLASWLIGNFYWSLAMYSGITIVEYIWQRVF